MRTGVALGSNLGERELNMQKGMLFLRGLSATDHFLCSSILSSEPVDCTPDSGVFLNAVVEIEWNGHPRELLRQLQAFELERGRAKVRPVNSPRPLDLDIIYYGDWICNDADLILPHPRAMLRGFVMNPLAEIRPELIFPGQGLTVRELSQRL